LIIATAGHVDHGKTSLVRNLTGVETDRLEEERRRGLSISLGYAYWRPDSRTTIGFIDVPGHRRFINNMISGISGIDLGLLVVAADDGPMPQTREHLQVMSLLGVDSYVLAVSKCDRVSEQRIDAVCAEMESLLPEDTSAFRISNITGGGIDELRSHLEKRARDRIGRSAKGPFRMSVDRAFTLQGVGLVVTGTIASGVVETGENLLLQPQGIALRVRSVHTQDKPSPAGRAGERCALNVSGNVHKDDIERGDWVVAKNSIEPTARFDTRIHLLPDAPFPLKNLAGVKLHIGAKHCAARLLLLNDGDTRQSRLRPGESAFAQILTERPIHCCHGDRFLLRDNGETATLGGGIVLDPRGPNVRRSSTSRIAYLAAMAQNDVRQAISDTLSDTRRVLDYDAMLHAWNLDPDDRPGGDLSDIARIETDQGELWLAESRWSKLKEQILESLRDYHERQPDKPGVQLKKLASMTLARDEQRLFQPAVVQLIRSGDMVLKDGLLSASGFETRLDEQDDRDWQAISAYLRMSGRQIPGFSRLRDECGLDKTQFEQCLNRALRDRRIVKITPERYAETSVVNEFAQGVLNLTRDKPTLTVAELRDLMGCGRNVLIEILEYFDSLGFTRRTGNSRIVLDRSLPGKQFGN
jgi:selenocysteine-specific elongation factor